MKKYLVIIFCFYSLICFSQKTITGKVISDDSPAGMPGVNVATKESNNKTVTNSDGTYSIEVASDSDVLIFSNAGYKFFETSVGTKTTVDVSLDAKINTLDELIIVGYGKQSKRNVTGSISSVDLKNNLGNVDISSSFSGVSGVQFNQTGRPGEVGRILIRGQNSLSGNSDPLIVLDGIIFLGTLNDINPQDIQSIEVLKDASSTAIYGSRAANGVILITSKKGTTDKATITLNVNSGFSQPSSELKLLSPERYIQRRLDWRKQSGLEADPTKISTYLSDTEAENYKKGIWNNPWREISQRGEVNTVDLSISGRSQVFNYFLSASHSEEKGLIYGDNLKRNTVRSNIEIKVNKDLTLGTNSTYSNRDLSGISADLYQAYRSSPLGTYYYADGSPTEFPVPTEQAAQNPMRNALLTDNERISNNLFSNFYAELNIPYVDGLSYRLNFSPNFIWDHDYNFTRQDKNITNNNTKGSKVNEERYNWFLENIVKYNKTFYRNHNIDLTLLYSRNHSQFENTSASAERFAPDVLGFNNLALGNSPKVSSLARASDGVSYMARVNYRFKNRYLLTFTARKDGSSVFAANNKYATFPSGAIAWIASEEDFIKRLEFVNLLKFRVSYGAVGNQAIDPYQSLSLSNTRTYLFGDGGSTALGVVTSTLGNDDLKWETTYTTNVGVDFEMFKKRLSGSVELYYSKTEDLLVRQTIPVMTGYNSILTNIGQVDNKGIEVSLASTNITTDSFRWTTNASFTYNKNEIVHLFGNDLNGDGIEDNDIANSWFIGQPIESYYDYVFDGIYQVGDSDIPVGSKPGFVRVRDLNGDGKINSNDRAVVGSGGSPKYQFGITNTLSYKNFSFSFFINAMQGWEAPFNLINPLVPGRSLNQLDTGWWTAENQSNTRPSLTYSNPLGTNFYVSRDFVRLQNVTFSYDFNKSMLENLNISKLSLYINAKNLYTYTKWLGPDPENGGAYRSEQGSNNLYPLARTFSLGLNASF